MQDPGPTRLIFSSWNACKAAQEENPGLPAGHFRVENRVNFHKAKIRFCELQTKLEQLGPNVGIPCLGGKSLIVSLQPASQYALG